MYFLVRVYRYAFFNEELIFNKLSMKLPFNILRSEVMEAIITGIYISNHV